MFALRSLTTGNLATFEVESNDGAEFCNSVSFSFCRLGCNGDPLWVTANREVAELAAVNDTPWYNAGFNSPQNRFVGDWEVVELNVR